MRNYLNDSSRLRAFALIASFTAQATLYSPGLQANTNTPAETHASAQHQISGSIGDGPVVGADLFIYDRRGGLIANRSGDAFANYRLNVPRSTNYPVRIEAIRGRDLVTNRPLDFTLKSVWLAHNQGRANLNPYSTLIVEAAGAMRHGLTAANIQSATRIVVREMNFGLDTRSVPDPIRTPITPANAANIVRASEALGETIRRTRSSLARAGQRYSHNDIVRALGHDLRDGRLDGRGGQHTNARISATANVVSAQVLVEILQNRLYVNGRLATRAMDQSIRRVMSNARAMTDSVPVTAPVLQQTREALAAVRAIDSRSQVNALGNTVNRIRNGMRPAQVRRTLNDSHARLLNSAVNRIAREPARRMHAVNATQRNSQQANSRNHRRPNSGRTNPSDRNQRPMIAGDPSRSVLAGRTYRFVPTATDRERDTLRFSIVNKPRWAQFNPRTGQLSGTPRRQHVGNYRNIIIRVSDGHSTNALPPFLLEVRQAGGRNDSQNRRPTISGRPDTQVRAGTLYAFAPSAVDMDGGRLTFRVANRPAWASFNPRTGRLSGTPTAAQAGVYNNIRISVSDGRASAALPAFSIRVTSARNQNPGRDDDDRDDDDRDGADGDRDVTLRWTAPRTRADGSRISFSEIENYRIRYGTSPGRYTQSVMVDDETRHTIRGLRSGTYYFVVSAVDDDGLESRFSEAVRVRVQ